MSTMGPRATLISQAVCFIASSSAAVGVGCLGDGENHVVHYLPEITDLRYRSGFGSTEHVTTAAVHDPCLCTQSGQGRDQGAGDTSASYDPHSGPSQSPHAGQQVRPGPLRGPKALRKRPDPRQQQRQRMFGHRSRAHSHG